MPSSSFRQTFPVKPSQTTTSPAWRRMWRLSTFPPKRAGDVRIEAGQAFVSAAPGIGATVSVEKLAGFRVA